MSGVLRHIALEVGDEFVHGEERLVVVHTVTDTERRGSVNPSAEAKSVSVAVDDKLHTGVAAMFEGDVSALVDTHHHFGGEGSGNEADF